MSWFSLSMEGKPVVNLYQTIQSVCTGSIIRKAIYKNIIRYNAANLYARNLFIEQFSPIVFRNISFFNHDATEKILKMSLQKEKLSYITKIIKNKFMLDPKKNLMLIGKEGAEILASSVTNCVKSIPNKISIKPTESETAVTEKLEDKELSENQYKEMKNFVIENYGKKETEVIFDLLKQARITDAILQSTIYALRPVCEKAVLQSLVSVSKAGTGLSYDFLIKKGFSFLVNPLIYGVAYKAIEKISDLYNYYGPQSSQPQCFNFVSWLPTSPTKIIAISAIFSSLHIIEIIWNESRKHRKSNDVDKDDVKKLALEMAKEPVALKLMENPLLNLMGVTRKKEHVDAIVEALISEVIDFYWNDLNHIKFLGLPLVS